MEPQQIKSHLTELAKAIDKIEGEDFNCGLFFMSADSAGDRVETTALALGAPKEIAALLIGGLIELTEKEEMFLPVVMATSLSLINAMMMESNGTVYPFVLEQLNGMQEHVTQNSKDAEEIVDKALKNILKNLH